LIILDSSVHAVFPLQKVSNLHLHSSCTGTWSCLLASFTCAVHLTAKSMIRDFGPPKVLEVETDRGF